MVLPRFRDRERGNRIACFSVDTKVLATGRQDLELWPGLQQLRHQFGAGLHQVFAIVEDQQQSPVLREFHQRLDDRMPGFFLHAEDKSNRLRHEPRIGERRQLDEPDAIGKIVQDLGRELLRQTRLADPACAE